MPVALPIDALHLLGSCHKVVVSIIKGIGPVLPSVAHKDGAREGA